MKTPDIEKIEHLLQTKSFGELSSAEKDLVMALVSGEPEYEHMRATLTRVKNVFQAEALTLQPDAELKENILLRFEQNKPVSGHLAQSVSIFFQSFSLSSSARFALTLSVILLVGSTGLVWYYNPKTPIASNTDKTEFEKPAESPVVTEEIVDKTGVSNDVVKSDRAEYPLKNIPLTEDLEFAKPEESTKESITTTAVSPKVSDAIREETPVPIYRNDDGYLQYANTRTVQAEETQKEKSAPGAPKTATGIFKKTEQERVTSDKKTAVKPSKADGQALSESFGNGAGMTSAETRVPFWPPMNAEEKASVLTQKTTEKLEAYFSAENKNNQDEESVFKLIKVKMYFSENGEVKKAEILSGNLNNEEKKAFTEKALKLPRFVFSQGEGALQKTPIYTLRIR